MQYPARKVRNVQFPTQLQRALPHCLLILAQAGWPLQQAYPHQVRALVDAWFAFMGLMRWAAATGSDRKACTAAQCSSTAGRSGGLLMQLSRLPPKLVCRVADDALLGPEEATLILWTQEGVISYSSFSHDAGACVILAGAGCPMRQSFESGSTLKPGLSRCLAGWDGQHQPCCPVMLISLEPSSSTARGALPTVLASVSLVSFPARMRESLNPVLPSLKGGQTDHAQWPWWVLMSLRPS